MSEEREIHLTLDVAQGEPVLCPYCQAHMGEIIAIDGAEMLKVGENAAARYFHGYCLSCGNEFHWSANDRMLARLVKKVMG